LYSIDQIKAGFAFDTCPRYTIEPIIGWETKANVTGIPKEKYFGKMGKKEKSEFVEFGII